MHARSGAVLPFVLLLGLALYGLAWAVLVTGSSALRSTRSAATLAVMTSAADAVLDAALEHGPDEEADTVRVTNALTRVDTVTGRSVRTEWTRLSPEAWRVAVSVRPGPDDLPGPSLPRSRLAWRLDPSTRVAALADVTIGPGAPVSPPGAAGTWSVDIADTIRVGLLPLDALRGGALPVVGSFVPGPVSVGGSCDTTVPENFGDPYGSSSCAGYVAHRRADATVELRQGSGHLLLTAAGDIVISEGARLRGLLVTQGRVVVSGGSFEGLVIALGGLEVGPAGSFVPDRAAARAALEAYAAAHRRALPLHPARDLVGR